MLLNESSEVSFMKSLIYFVLSIITLITISLPAWCGDPREHWLDHLGPSLNRGLYQSDSGATMRIRPTGGRSSHKRYTPPVGTSFLFSRSKNIQ